MTSGDTSADETAPVTLTTSHWYADCSCKDIARVVCVKHPIRANVLVRVCTQVYGRRPIGDAIDVLSEFTGMRFIDKEEALTLVRQISSSIPGEVIGRAETVACGGFGRAYYMKRDILRLCAEGAYVKCEICGVRNCRDIDHRRVVDDIFTLERCGAGQVYFLLHEPTQYVKVGFSTQPTKRLSGHAAAIPGKLTVLGVFPGGRYLERSIHEDLSDWLVPGHQEWFFYCPAVRDYLSRIRAVYVREGDMLVFGMEGARQ